MDNVDEILEYLKEHRSEKYKKFVTKLGIPEANSLGVSMKVLRELAKQVEGTQDLVEALWNTGCHEAQLLAVLLVDPYKVAPKWAISRIDDVHSWDLCDHLCKNVLFCLPEFEDLILTWQRAEQLYRKRAAFVLIVCAVIHDKKLEENVLDTYLELIRKHQSDSRIHVKKAVSWALRTIGKSSIRSFQKAKLIATSLMEDSNVHRQWVGRDAFNEFNKLIPYTSKNRMVPKNGKIGKLLAEGKLQ